MGYLINERTEVAIEGDVLIAKENVLKAINFCNNAIRDLHLQTRQFEINIFEILGMRNLSGLVGEYFVKSIERFSDGNLHSNLHQDGYPDLLRTNTAERIAYYKSLYTENEGKKYPKDKSFFNPFKFGGIEVKATCGSTPPAERTPKPLIGEQRIKLLEKFEWKAHHRETNNLLAILWDFIDEMPTIVACFYRNDLSIEDWGNVVSPKKGKGRTTSVSIMKSKGVKKMCNGWLTVINSETYIEALSSKKWIGYRVDSSNSS